MNSKGEKLEHWFHCYSGSRGDLFDPASNIHPGKMAVPLCWRIFEHGREKGYWKPGDVILDPMAGIGTTLVVGYSLGYNVIGVELEEHFARLLALNMAQCVEKVGPKGWFRIMRGDARRLRDLLAAVDGVVTSPPYAGDAPTHRGPDCNERRKDNQGRKTQHGKLGVSLRSGGNSGAITSPPYGEALQSKHGIDASKVKRPGGPASQTRISSNYSAAVTRPPYGGPPGKPGNATADGESELGREKGIHGQYVVIASMAQIGNLRDPRNDIDAVLTSPPYSQETNRDRHTGKYWRGGGLPAERNYGDTSGQIELERGETYLSAMLQVYCELHMVLKPGGVVCLVTKNPVKTGAIRRLDEDTIRLMKAAGFSLLERKMAMLSEDLGEQMLLDGGIQKIRRVRKSFFKRLFERKRPDLAVDHEDVLFFRSRRAADA